jgi:DNA repair exonuclease SbcCD ATPase subunit
VSEQQNTYTTAEVAELVGEAYLCGKAQPESEMDSLRDIILSFSDDKACLKTRIAELETENARLCEAQSTVCLACGRSERCEPLTSDENETCMFDHTPKEWADMAQELTRRVAELLADITARDLAVQSAQMRSMEAEKRAGELEAELTTIRARAAEIDVYVGSLKRDAQLVDQAGLLKRALQSLVRQLELVHEDPDYKSVWALAQTRLGKYCGITYTYELRRAKEALTSIDNPVYTFLDKKRKK